MIDIYNFIAVRDFRRLVDRLKPDVINTSIIDGFSPSIFRVAKLSGAHLVHTLRDYYLICRRSGMYRNGRNCSSLCLSCRFSAYINQLSTRHIDLILSNSQFVADRHTRHGVFSSGQDCFVQLNANTDVGAMQPRSLFGPVVFGYIGRLDPTKGVEQLLAAVSLLQPSGRTWELRIAGAGDTSYSERIKALSANDSRIKLLGWLKPEDFYRNVDVLICPSTYHEPLPRVIYEGYGYALPVIASDAGGNPEIVQTGKTGFLYPAHSASELANRMDMFRNMSEEQYSYLSDGALRLSERFSLACVLDTYEKHIASLLEK